MQLISLFTPLKFLHILFAIIAVGFNASYGIWVARAAREPAHLSHVLQGIRILDHRFANPCYALLLITGLSMVFVGNIPLTTFWIAAALALYVIAIVIGFGFYTPALRRQIQLLESGGADSPEYQGAARRQSVFGIATMIIVILILIMMVFKPTPG